MLIFGLNFGSFCWGFWSSLGSSWEPSWVSWGSLGRPLDPKNLKKLCFLRFFENVTFWACIRLFWGFLKISLFEVFWGFLKMSWRHGKRFFVFLFLLVFGFTIWPLFDQCLDHLWVSLWVSLRSLLGPLEVLLEASGSKNTKKLQVFQGFWKCSFLALWSSWWLSWAHLAPFWADLIPKWAPKWASKVLQKVTKKLSKTWSK